MALSPKIYQEAVVRKNNLKFADEVGEIEVALDQAINSGDRTILINSMPSPEVQIEINRRYLAALWGGVIFDGHHKDWDARSGSVQIRLIERTEIEKK